ncbi:hypothetical protein LOTGIDRAFT_176562, partial [Lottia gigantea]
ESEECDKTEIIVGQLGKELVLNFPLSDLRDEYNKYITERDSVKKFKESETTIQDLKNDSDIRFKNKMDSKNEEIMFEDGNSTHHSASSEITITDDAFVVNKTDLQKEDAGIYWIDFNVIHLGQKSLLIAGKPKIKCRPPPNPVMIAEDSQATSLQLECHSVSTSIGDCQLVNNSMYIMWYKNGMRMTDLDPTLSQINVTVDHNGGNFTCLATEYHPCYQRLQTTKHYDVLNIEECNNVFESETLFIKTQHVPIDVKLDPDQREVTVTTETKKKELMSVEMNIVIFAIKFITGFIVVVIVFVIAVGCMVMMCKKYHKKKNHHHNLVLEEGIYDTIDESLIGTSRNDNSRNGEQNMDSDIYDLLEFNTLDGQRSDPEV